MGTFYTPQVTGDLALPAVSGQYKVKGVGREELKWEGGRAAVMFLEFSGRPDTGSLFPVPQATLWGQAGHALPSAEDEQLSAEPFPAGLSL